MSCIALRTMERGNPRKNNLVCASIGTDRLPASDQQLKCYFAPRRESCRPTNVRQVALQHVGVPMTIVIKTNDPSQLLKEIRVAINQGHIDTWSYDDVGDFTHTPEQWKYKAWLRPHVEARQLRFSLVSNNKQTLTKAVYGVYHGRFSEMLITHFDDQFAAIEATTKQVEYTGA